MKRFLMALCILLTAANVYAWDARSGWWYSPSKSGTGISMEINGANLFLAVYDYSNGEPVWYSAFGQVNGGHFEGRLQKWQGWPLGSQYFAPSYQEVGNIAVDFSGDDAAVVQMSLGEVSASVSIKKFMPDVSPGALDTRDINGWWYDPKYDGMGFFLEARGNTAFIAWYHYGAGGAPEWWSGYGPFGPTYNSLVCEMTRWHGGSAFESPDYHAPASDGAGGAVYVLTGPEKMTLLFGRQTYHLVRFRY